MLSQLKKHSTHARIMQIFVSFEKVKVRLITYRASTVHTCYGHDRSSYIITVTLRQHKCANFAQFFALCCKIYACAVFKKSAVILTRPCLLKKKRCPWMHFCLAVVVLSCFIKQMLRFQTTPLFWLFLWFTVQNVKKGTHAISGLYEAWK